jgi:hypothetical protein
MRRPLRVGLYLGVAVLAFWAFAVLLREPLSTEYFRQRDSRIRWTTSGVEFDLVSDVDPALILLDRPFLYPLGPENAAVLSVGIDSLPALLSAAAATEWLGAPARQGSMGYRQAARVGTVVFAAVSFLQWWFMGACSAHLYTRAKRRAGEQPVAADEVRVG